MAYVYNDAQMMMATQIAYLDIPENVSIGAEVDKCLSYGYRDSSGNWVLKDEYKGNSFCEKKFEVAKNIKELSEKNPVIGEKWRKWKIVDRCDDNNGTGYYGCLIDTGDNNALIANRGSESYDGEQTIKDWVVADLGLLDSRQTTQQKKAEQYMERLYYKYGDKYESFSVTGHSLGGNLAEDMVIHAPAAMRDKIDHCISFDGPGFSDEYIKHHGGNIDKVKDKMSHYQWSWVSALLNPLPGVTDTIIKAHDEEGITDPLKSALWRHDIHNIELDENGNYQEGDSSWLSKKASKISRTIDNFDVVDAVTGLIFSPKITKLIIGIKLIRAAITKFEQIRQQFQNWVQNIYYNFIAPNVSGEYELSVNSLTALKEELVSSQRSLESVASELGSIMSNWPYNSCSGAYYRSLVFFEKCGLENDISKLKKIAEAVEYSASTYSSADSRAAELFY